MGINHSTYVSNGYAKPRRLFTDILDGVRVSNRIIPNSIARNSKIVLCDYTEFSGNFQQISLIMLNRIKKNSKCEIEYNE